MQGTRLPVPPSSDEVHSAFGVEAWRTSMIKYREEARELKY